MINSFMIMKFRRFIIILVAALFVIPSFAKQQELPNVALVGTMNGWESNANPFTPAEDGQTASLTLNMVSDGYIHLFKILVGSNELTVHGNYFEFSRNNNSAILNDADPNSEVLALILDGTGDYTFTWTYADSLLTITYPEKVKFYITGNAALVGEELEWNPAAIKSVEDSYTLHLASGFYEMKVTLDGTWEGVDNVKGYNELTEKAEGLKDIGEYHNIGFALVEESDVIVTYTEDVFKLEGNFYVSPLPQIALAGDMNEWNPTDIFVPAKDSLTATLKLMLEKNEYEGYAFKVVVDNNWLGWPRGEDPYILTRENNSVKVPDYRGEDDDIFWLHVDSTGEYTFTWTYADSTLVVNYPSESYVSPKPQIALVGEMNEWNPTDIFVPAKDSLTATLKLFLEENEHEGYAFKVVVDSNWLGWPRGEEPYILTRENNSVKVPNYNGADDDLFWLHVDVTGEYTFTWTYADSTLVVDYPSELLAATFVVTDFEGLGTPSVGSEVSVEKNGITFWCDKAYGNSPNSINCYRGSTIRISSSNRKFISVIASTFANGRTGNLSNSIFVNDAVWQVKLETLACFETISVYCYLDTCYYISVESNDTTMGTVSGSGLYIENSTATLTATPKPEFQFGHWSDGNTDNPRMIQVTQDTTLTAIFQNWIPPVISVDEAVTEGMKLDSAATSVNEYIVEGYVHDAELFSVTFGNQNWYMSDFEWLIRDDFQAYHCTAIQGSDTLCVLNGDKVRLQGRLKKYWNKSKNIYVIEIVNGVATFLKMTEGDHTVDTSIERISVKEALGIGQNLNAGGRSVKSYEVVGYVSAIEAGTESDYILVGSQRFWISDTKGSTAASNAENAFYVFRGVPDHRVQVYDQVSVTTAIYRYQSDLIESETGVPVELLNAYVPTYYTISVRANNDRLGTVTGDGSHPEWTTISISASPATNCRFVQWADGVKDNPREVYVDGDASYIAIFAAIPGNGNGHTSNDSYDEKENVIDPWYTNGAGHVKEGLSGEENSQNSENEVLKVWIEGHLYIISQDGTIYNAFGQICEHLNR